MPNDAIYPSLKDRVVLVTGGAMGIGEAIVRGFAAQGSRIGFLDIADAAAEKLRADLRGQGTLHYEHCDVTDIAALRRAIETGRDILAMRDQHEDPVAHRGAPANVLVPVQKTGSSTLPRYALKSSNEPQRALRNPCPTMRSTPA